MFGRAVKNILRKELLNKGQRSEKSFKRTILTTQSALCTSRKAEDKSDSIINSPLPSVKYPEWTVCQYVWNDINKWSDKTALVRSED